MRYVYLIRHGELDLPDTKKRCYSRTELSLSPRGIEQGKELCTWAAKRGIEAVYTSPLGRCRETAALMSGGALPVHTVNALREVDVGEWEGLPFDEIRERWPTVYAARGNKMSEVAPPGGESFYRAAVRFNDALQDIMSTRGTLPSLRIAVLSAAGSFTSPSSAAVCSPSLCHTPASRRCAWTKTHF